MSRRERNAVGLKSGDAVADAVPVLNPSPSLDSSEIAKLVEFFLLLDTWDRRRDDTPLL